MKVRQMAYDEQLAERVRTIFQTEPTYSEKKMFGRVCFMVAGEIAVDFLVTVGTSLIANKRRTGNLRRRGQGGDRYAPGGGAGNEDGTGQGETEQCRKIQKPAQR